MSNKNGGGNSPLINIILIFSIIAVLLIVIIYQPSLLFMLLLAAGIIALLQRYNITKSDSLSHEQPKNKYSVEQKRAEFSSVEDQGRFEEGKLFERYIASLFNSYYTIEDWTRDNFDKTRGFYVESNKNPDLTIRYNPSKERFAVECKYRSSSYYSALYNESAVYLAKEDQLSRYRQFSEERGIPVFIVVGLRGKPDNPLEVFCVPLNDIVSTEMPISSLNRYKRSYAIKDFFWKNGVLN
ncbi:MAG: hypothetical protein QME57_04665 [Patescibacteria group bacterium]|nr:hypothetical protein [Patescibacteria group bacterium]